MIHGTQDPAPWPAVPLGRFFRPDLRLRLCHGRFTADTVIVADGSAPIPQIHPCRCTMAHTWERAVSGVRCLTTRLHVNHQGVVANTDSCGVHDIRHGMNKEVRQLHKTQLLGVELEGKGPGKEGMAVAPPLRLAIDF